MFAVLSLACATGAGCGLGRLNAWAIISAGIILMLIAAFVGVRLELPWDRIALIVFSVLILLQVSYLVGAALSDVPTRYWISGPMPEKQALLRTVQTSIANDLRTYFKTPRDVPPLLRSKLAFLETR